MVEFDKFKKKRDKYTDEIIDIDLDSDIPISEKKVKEKRIRK